MTTDITIETEGRRHYLIGNTYPIKDRLRAAGAKWDGDRRAWWTGKRELAEKLVGASTAVESGSRPSSERPSDSLSSDSEIAGKAQYKGKEYLLVWSGDTRRGPAAKLAFRDGSKVFWAPLGEVRITKVYEAREYRGRREPGMTFGRLERLRKEYSEAKRQGNDDGIPNGRRYECPECGEYVTRGEGSCWETGCAH